MNIQSNYGLQAFQNAGKVSAQAPVAATQAQSSVVGGTSSSTTDKVSISSAARALAFSEKASTPARTPAQERLMETVKDDTDANVDRVAYDLAYSQSRVAFDISHGDTRLASTGQVVSDDYVSNFDKLAAAVDAQQRALYDFEKAKGTDPKEILAKIIDFRNAQSVEYKTGTAWGRA